MRLRTIISAGALALASSTCAMAGDPPVDIPRYQRPEPVQLQAELLRRYPAPEAGQGAALDSDHVYAVVNHAIGKYRRDSGERVARWVGPRGGLIRHLNSCFAEDGALWCAHSNHPQVPMASSIEIFDTGTLAHTGTRSFGHMDAGSLVWFDHLGDGWIAGFAHYSDETGDAFKSNRYSEVVRFDSEWRRTGGWMLPEHLLDGMSPQWASGGAIGPDGLLYVMGHDRPEMYALAAPAMGPALIHVATIAIDAPGQAFAFAPGGERVVAAISRREREVRVFRLPAFELDAPNARPME